MTSATLMTLRTVRLGAAALLLAAGLAACGGGGDGFQGFAPVAGTPPPAQPAPPAATPYEKFLSFVQDLVARALDTQEPADISAFDPPPTSETLEPISVQ